MKYKITALCLCLVLIASFFVMTPVSAVEQSEIDLMFDLGIVESLPKTGLVKQSFNRGMFAVSLSLMDGSEAKLLITDEEISGYATDISLHKDKAAIIEALVGGFMETTDGKFNPSQPLTEEAAIVALVRKLGYETHVQKQGGTTADYYTVARRLGLYRGVTIANNEALRDEEVAELVANAMNVIVYPAQGNFYDCWSLKKRTGKILANSSMGLLSERTSAGRVNISGVVYPSAVQITNELVGSAVTFYTDSRDGWETVVSIHVNADPETLTVASGDIEAVKESGGNIVVTYNEDEQVLLDKSGFAMVNGTTKSPSIQLFNAFKTGTATFVDNNDDGIYDVVHMNLVIYDLIEGVSTESKSLVTKYSHNKLSANKVKSFEVFINGKTADISELQVDMVIGIVCDAFTLTGTNITYDYDKAAYLRIEATTKQVSGRVTEINQSGTVTIDGMDYILGAGYNYLLSQNYIESVSLSGCRGQCRLLCN